MFKENHRQIREQQIDYQYRYMKTGGSRDSVEASMVASPITRDVPQESPTPELAPLAPLDPNLGYDPSAITPMSHTLKLTRYTTTLKHAREDPPNLPRIHFLETSPHWLNIRWKLMSMPYDMMYSSQYLNRINLGRRVYRAWTTSSMWRLPIR